MEDYFSFFDDIEEMDFLSRKRAKDNDFFEQEEVKEEEISCSNNLFLETNKDSILEKKPLDDLKEIKSDTMEEIKEEYDLNIKINSICIMFNTNSDIDLKGIKCQLNKNVNKYHFKTKSVSIIMKFPRCNIIITNKGKINVFGLKDEESIGKLIIELNKMHLNNKGKVKLKEYIITNIMGWIDIGFKINLYKLAENELFIYNPEIYKNNVALYISKSPPINLRIYHKGLINFLGAKSRDSVKIVMDKIYSILKHNEYKG